MTVANINDTITTSIDSRLGQGTASGYATHIAGLTEALTERERAITDAILDKAKGYVTEEEARGMLESAGLALRPEPEEEVTESVTGAEGGKKSKSERLAVLEENQVEIVKALDKLTRLAERHLGSL